LKQHSLYGEEQVVGGGGRHGKVGLGCTLDGGWGKKTAQEAGKKWTISIEVAAVEVTVTNVGE